ncbi:MAG: hypothetical protein WC136_08030 [Sphaerochaeta sp.]|nr:hypothetical protein [Sphaerochaeta sp.]
MALLVRNRIYTFFKYKMLKQGKKLNIMIVAIVLKELEKIEMVKCADGVYRLDHAVIATQQATFDKKAKKVLLFFSSMLDC